jgi:hypothetical protein
MKLRYKIKSGELNRKNYSLNLSGARRIAEPIIGFPPNTRLREDSRYLAMNHNCGFMSFPPAVGQAEGIFFQFT